MISTISNEYIVASIKTLGAELCSLKLKEDELEYIWQGDKKYWNRHAPVLFPIVGKLLDNQYIYGQKTYEMNQHGFARDMEFEIENRGGDFISFKLKSTKETKEIYPFDFILYIDYKLIKNSLQVSYRVQNRSENKMLFSIGAHPAFNWPLDHSIKEDYFMEFDDMEYFERLPLKQKGISKQKEKILLDNNKLQLDEKLFEDDALIMEDIKNKTIAFKNSMDNKMIQVDFDGFSYLGIWSKPSGAPFVCIEPWCGIADFEDHNKEFENKIGLNSLGINEEFKSTYSITIK